MRSFKVLLLVFAILIYVPNAWMIFFKYPSEVAGAPALRKAFRVNVPWLGIGMYCNGCPPSACEDDEAIIHGYCCGCALAFDDLPVMCPKFLQCPLNGKGLCHDYEYMMRCCC